MYSKIHNVLIQIEPLICNKVPPRLAPYEHTTYMASCLQRCPS